MLSLELFSPIIFKLLDLKDLYSFLFERESYREKEGQRDRSELGWPEAIYLEQLLGVPLAYRDRELEPSLLLS